MIINISMRGGGGLTPTFEQIDRERGVSSAKIVGNHHIQSFFCRDFEIMLSYFLLWVIIPPHHHPTFEQIDKHRRFNSSMPAKSRAERENQLLGTH